MWIIRTLKFSLAFIAAVFALLLLEDYISFKGELAHVQNEVIVHLFSFCIGFTVWGTIELIEKHLNKLHNNKTVANNNEKLEEMLNTIVGSRITNDIGKMTHAVENSIETKFNTIRRLPQEEAFLLAKDAITKANNIYAIGVVKEAQNEKKDYLDATLARLKQDDVRISYKRIMSHNISEEFMAHLSLVLDTNKNSSKKTVQKTAEILIGTNFCLPYSSLIIDKNFLMMSLNYAGSPTENDSYIVSKDPEFIDKFSKHFDYIWGKLKSEHKNKCITKPEQLIFLHEYIKKISDQCIRIADSTYGYPQNEKNFSLNYAVDSLGEISDLFANINAQSYLLKNTQKSKSLLGVYASFFEQMQPADSFETVTSVDFWANILRNKNLNDADFLKANKTLIDRGCNVKRILLLKPNLPGASKIEMSIDNIEKCAAGIENWNYWVSAKIVIRYHLGLMTKYKKNYNFKILFLSEKMIKEPEDDLNHFSLLTTGAGKTLFIATTDHTEEVHATNVITQIGKNAVQNSRIREAEKKLSELLTYHDNTFQVYKNQKKLIFSLKDEFKTIFEDDASLQNLLGKKYSNDIEDPASFANDFEDTANSRE